MVPDRERVTFCNPDNWFEQEVSGEVAGIIVTALVLNHRSFYHSHHDNDELCAHFCHRFSALMAFIETTRMPLLFSAPWTDRITTGGAAAPRRDSYVRNH
jgi:hypothetical protein